MTENIVKQTAKELGMTYKELGEAIGYSEGTVNNSTRGTVSKAMAKAIELYLENIELKKQLESTNTLKSVLKDLINN